METAAILVHSPYIFHCAPKWPLWLLSSCCYVVTSHANALYRKGGHSLLFQTHKSFTKAIDSQLPLRALSYPSSSYYYLASAANRTQFLIGQEHTSDPSLSIPFFIIEVLAPGNNYVPDGELPFSDWLHCLHLLAGFSFHNRPSIT